MVESRSDINPEFGEVQLTLLVFISLDRGYILYILYIIRYIITQ